MFRKMRIFGGVGDGNGDGSGRGSKKKNGVGTGSAEEVVVMETGMMEEEEFGGTDSVRTSLDDENTVASGAEDTDGMRAARARLSLDDANIRCRPTVGFRRVAMDAELNPLRDVEVNGEMEGVVLIDKTIKLPVQVGACGKAGWEPIRGQSRRSSLEVRKENQDAYLAIAPFVPSENQMLFGVFDGHGAEGRKVSHLARSTVAKVLRDFSYDSPEELLAPLNADHSEAHRTNAHRNRMVVLHKAFRAAEEELRKPHRDIEHLYSGTTGVITWLIGTDMYCAWTGDSRAIMGYGVSGTDRDKRFKVADLSIDHKPMRSDERKRIRAKGGRVARWRRNMGPLRVWLPSDWIPGLAMTRSIGDTILTDFGVYPVPEVTYVKLTSEESFIVIASDGVWEFMTSQEVTDFVGKRRAECVDPSVAAEALVREAIQRWRRNELIIDDTTAVIVYLNFEGAMAQPTWVRKGFFRLGKQARGNKTVHVSPNGQTH